MWSWLGRATATANRAGGGLGLDIGLYLLSALFAVLTASSSTLMPHRAWGAIAAVGYGLASIVALTQLGMRSRQQGHPIDPHSSVGPPFWRWLSRWRWRRRQWQWLWGPGARAALAACVWGATALLPLVLQAMQRATGRTDRAQEEVLVIEDGGRRLLDTSTPYLDRAAIAALPESERLLGYLPYQPGMAVFGAPRALDASAQWWSDARVWFALVTVAALAAALVLLRRAGAPAPTLVRGLQVATVLPVCALTLATGGDDLPVLALCLLALTLAATRRLGGAGLAVGAAAALKLFAWPVALVLAVHAITQGRAKAARYAAGAFGVPLLTAAPALLSDAGAMIENVVAFAFGRGLVTSPAASPLPGQLIATSVPAGATVASVALLAAGVAIAFVLVRRPPRSAAATSLLCGYGLLAAILLLPSTRFGYLLYPTAFLVWAAALRSGDSHVLPEAARAGTP